MSPLLAFSGHSEGRLLRFRNCLIIAHFWDSHERKQRNIESNIAASLNLYCACAYGPNLLAFYRQQGVLAAKVLRGENPAELPIETPTKFEFVLKLKTAKLPGVNIPSSILLRADEVIE